MIMQDLMQEDCIRFIFYKFSQKGKMIAGNLVNFKSRYAWRWIVSPLYKINIIWFILD